MVRQQAAYVHSLYADRNSLSVNDTTETGQAQVSTGKAGESGTIPRPHKQSRIHKVISGRLDRPRSLQVR